ncbi:MAG: hypothetical protein Q8O15_02540, partial [Rectinemataceae bacterium]|nr:hypothetical protein [Rectinemataceae bacterium]
GNYNLTGLTDTINKITTIKTKDEECTKTEIYKNFSISLLAFYKLPFTNHIRKFYIEQINRVIISFNDNKNINEVLEMARNIELLLSFIFKKYCIIDNLSYDIESEVDGSTYISHNSIYYTHNIRACDNDKNDYDLFTSAYLKNNIGLFINNWQDIISSIPYLKYFITTFYNSQFIDYKVSLQLMLIEAYHKHYFGRTTDNKYLPLLKKYEDVIEKDDLNILRRQLSSMNGFGYPKQIDNLFLKAKIEIDNVTIDKMNKIRQKGAHGEMPTNISINEYIDISEKLSSVFNKLTFEELEKPYTEV